MPSQTPGTVLALLALPIPDFVQMAYSVLLGRQPEWHEANARGAALRTGWGRVRLLEDIVSSPEFRVKEQELLGDGSARAFVERHYLRYMNRMPDPHGLAHYTKMLDGGTSRDAVRRDIAGSEEALAAGSFWMELDRLLEDERKNMRRFGRWLGLLRRQERRRNLEIEVSNYQRDHEIRLSRVEAVRTADVLREEVLVDHRVTDVQPSSTQDATPAINMASLPPATRRMLYRLRHHQPSTGSITASIEGIY